MSKTDEEYKLRMARNDVARLLDYNYRGKRNRIYLGDNEGEAHSDKKFEICKWLIKHKKEFYTEAIFKNGMRADILVLDSCVAVEIVDTEKPESIEFKKQKYPVPVSVCKVDQKFVEEMLL